MPFCQGCGRYVEADVNYCPVCGAPQPPRHREPQMCDCKPCNGTGRVPGSVIDGMVITWVRCSKCKGKGKVRC